MPRSRQPLSYRQRADLYAQLAQMEIAGLPFDRAMSILAMPEPAQSRLVSMRALLSKNVEPALAGERSGLFSKIEARLIRAARNAGSPGNMYRRLADVYTARAMQLASMRSKLLLPGLMFLAALMIPPLPMLVGGTITVAGYFWGVVRPIILLTVAFYGLRWFVGRNATADGKSWQQSVPLYAAFYVRQNLRDFFESLALLLEAGVSMLDALPAALDTVEDADIRRELGKIRPRIEQGLALAGALRGIAYIDDAQVIEFTATGEASGTLPEMLMRHVALETASINSFFEQFAAWLPRIIYAMVAAMMTYQLLFGGGITPRIPG